MQMRGRIGGQSCRHAAPVGIWSGHTSEDDTRPSKSLDSKIHHYRGPAWIAEGEGEGTLATVANTSDDLAQIKFAHSSATTPAKYNITTPKRSPRRTSPRSVQTTGSMDTSGPTSCSTGPKSAFKALLVSFEDHDIMVAYQD